MIDRNFATSGIDVDSVGIQHWPANQYNPSDSCSTHQMLVTIKSSSPSLDQVTASPIAVTEFRCEEISLILLEIAQSTYTANSDLDSRWSRLVDFKLVVITWGCAPVTSSSLYKGRNVPRGNLSLVVRSMTCLDSASTSAITNRKDMA
jgi:hypothetical protein